MSKHGCNHGFAWTTNSTSQPTPPVGYLSQCASCGTWAIWQDGHWQEQQESPGSQAMGQAQRFGDALQRLTQVLGPPCPENGCEGCAWEANEALQIIREVHGV